MADTNEEPKDEERPMPLLLHDCLEGWLDEIEKVSEGTLAGVPTGFADLDSLTGGLRPSQLTVIGGRGGMGKSTLALNFLRSAAIHNGLPAALFTLESTRNEVIEHLQSAEARVALHHMRSGTMTDEDWAKLGKRIGEVSAAPLFIQDQDNLTYVQIRDQCRAMVEQYDLRLAVVDSINLLTYGTRPFENRYLEISEISRCLKQLAKELKISIVAVSQLNRAVETRTDRRPMLADLRDSGTLDRKSVV